MKGKIDKDGFLWIERKGEWTKQCCPFVGDDWCGQWCPLFGEPFSKINHAGAIISAAVDYAAAYSLWAELSLCKRTLYFDTFKDERGQEGRNNHHITVSAEESEYGEDCVIRPGKRPEGGGRSDDANDEL